MLRAGGSVYEAGTSTYSYIEWLVSINQAYQCDYEDVRADIRGLSANITVLNQTVYEVKKDVSEVKSEIAQMQSNF